MRALLNIYLGKERSTNGKIIENAQIICLLLQINWLLQNSTLFLWLLIYKGKEGISSGGVRYFSRRLKFTDRSRSWMINSKHASSLLSGNTHYSSCWIRRLTNGLSWWGVQSELNSVWSPYLLTCPCNIFIKTSRDYRRIILLINIIVFSVPRKRLIAPLLITQLPYLHEKIGSD